MLLSFEVAQILKEELDFSDRTVAPRYMHFEKVSMKKSPEEHVHLPNTGKSRRSKILAR